METVLQTGSLPGPACHHQGRRSYSRRGTSDLPLQTGPCTRKCVDPEEMEVWGVTPPLMSNWYLEDNEAVRKSRRKRLLVHTHAKKHALRKLRSWQKSEGRNPVKGGSKTWRRRCPKRGPGDICDPSKMKLKKRRRIWLTQERWLMQIKTFKNL